MGILLIIDYGVYVCICIVYSYVFKEFTEHAFVYDSHFQKKRRVNAVVQSFLIYHMHPFLYWRNKIEKAKVQWRICLGNSLIAILFWSFHKSYCKWFFVTYNGSLFIIIMYFDSIVWKIEDRNIQMQEFTGQMIWYDTISE